MVEPPSTLRPKTTKNEEKKTARRGRKITTAIVMVIKKRLNIYISYNFLCLVCFSCFGFFPCLHFEGFSITHIQWILSIHYMWPFQRAYVCTPSCALCRLSFFYLKSHNTFLTSSDNPHTRDTSPLNVSSSEVCFRFSLCIC